MFSTFESFGLSEDILTGVREAGFTVPSPIQSEVIPHILKGRDVVAQAHTGTGKTAAFGLSVMNMLKGGKQMLVITPTRELAMQVSDELYRLGRFAGIKTATVCGGQQYSRQKKLIEQGAQVVTATPGRLLDLLESGSIDSFKPNFVVLDEADEMLDMGFFEDIQSIFGYLPEDRQTLLFSATIPKMVEKLASTFLIDPVRVNTKTTASATNADIDELYFVIEEYERDDSLVRLIDFYDPTKAIVFTRTKKDADRVSTVLIARGYSAKCLHGDLSQPQREEVTRSFRKGDVTILVATDVASRGLDIQDVTHVFNFHLPFEAESYVHRVGRTGRAGNKGIAITLVTPQEYRGLTRIKKVIGSEMAYRKVPTLSETNQNLVESIVDDVRGVKQSRYAVLLLERLLGEMGLEEAAMKLSSIVLASVSFSGPENIGVAGKKLERLQNDTTSGSDRDRKRRPSSGRSQSTNSSWYNKRKSASPSKSPSSKRSEGGAKFDDRKTGERKTTDRKPGERKAGDRKSRKKY